MYQVIWQEDGKIEIALNGTVTEDEFRQVIHQLESLCTMHPAINVMFDAQGLEKYDFKIHLEEFQFFRNYKQHLRRVALVSDSRFAQFLLDLFNKYSDTEFKTFPLDEVEAARKWIFPSKLP